MNGIQSLAEMSKEVEQLKKETEEVKHALARCEELLIDCRHRIVLFEDSTKRRELDIKLEARSECKFSFWVSMISIGIASTMFFMHLLA